MRRFIASSLATAMFLMVAIPALAIAVETQAVTILVTVPPYSGEQGQITVNGEPVDPDTGAQRMVDPAGVGLDLLVTANPGFEIDTLQVGDLENLGPEDVFNRQRFERSFTVDGDIEIRVNWRQEQQQFTVTLTAGPNGSISPPGPVTVNAGDSLEVQALPDDGYEVSRLLVNGATEYPDGDNRYTINNIQDHVLVEVEFRQVDASTFWIETIVGPNGSLDPMNPTGIPRGADVTFTITPEPGYMIDYLFVDGRPEMPSPDNTFTIFNLDRDCTLEVGFTEMVERAVTVIEPSGGDVWVSTGGSSPERVVGSQQFIGIEGRDISLYYRLDSVRMTLSEVLVTEIPEVGDPQEYGAYLGLSYDQQEDKIRLDLPVNADMEVRSTVVQDYLDGGYEPVAILTEESLEQGDPNSQTGMHYAIRREMAMHGVDIPTDQMGAWGIAPGLMSENGVEYSSGFMPVLDDGIPVGTISFLAVDDVANVIVEMTPLGGTRLVYIVDAELFPDWSDSAEIEVGAMSEGTFSLYGPRGTRMEGLMTSGLDDVLVSYDSPISNHSYRTARRVLERFGLVQYHVAGQEINWMPLTIMQNDALITDVSGVNGEGVAEGGGMWNVESMVDLTSGPATHQVYFGNSTVVIGKMRSGGGGVASVSVSPEIIRPGYTITNGPDGTVVVQFLSDFYELLDVDLIVTGEDDSEVRRVLTIHRTGVELASYDYYGEGEPPNTSERWTWHGTQIGSRVDLRSGANYQVTASYYLPGFSDSLPYGLYVTREWSDGRVETELITAPMDDPRPENEFAWNATKKVWQYKESPWSDRTFSVADYLVYSGADAASAPDSIRVLVLRDAPVSSGSFGGLYFGSGAGVPWNKR